MEESPLHPFELHNFIPISLGGLDISINKAVVMMWVVVALVTLLMVVAGSSRKLIPGKLQNLAEMLVDFIRGIIMDTMGSEGMKFFPLIATLFLFILFCNLLGLIPGTYTVTSQIVVTAVFALTVYGLSILLGFLLHGMKFLGILIPPGTPGWLLPLMMPIELISQLARPISLAVRLFANMTAGHTVLTVLFGMAITLPVVIASFWNDLWLPWKILSAPLALVIAPLPFLFTIIMNGFEIFIGCIQAYIFTTLTCVYLGDAVTLHGHDEHAH